jgi:hypothetical protein
MTHLRGLMGTALRPSKWKVIAVGNPYTNISMLIVVTPTPGFAITAEYEVLSRSEARHQGTLQST